MSTPFKVTNSVPIPEVQIKWTEFLLGMKVGQSFIVYSKVQVDAARVTAKRKGISVRAKLEKKGEWRVWRTS